MRPWIPVSHPEEIRPGLATRWLARDIRYLDSTDSTNRDALELARAGAAHGTVVIAEGQTAGRGRLSRSFFSPAYLNLYTSILLRPQITAGQAPLLRYEAAGDEFTELGSDAPPLGVS